MPFRTVTKGYRGRLQPATHRYVEMEARRPLFCVTLSLTVTLILATVFAVSAWNLERNQFERDARTFHGGDEVAVTDVCGDYSVLFCDSYDISLLQPAEVLSLPYRAKVNNSDVITSDILLQQNPSSYMDARGLYLLHGSSISLDLCRNNDSSDARAEVCFIRGKHNFNEYHKTPTSSLCLAHRVIPHDVTCGGSHEPISINITTHANDDYYIVLSYGRDGLIRRHDDKPGIVAAGFVSRTHFITAHSRRVCRWSAQRAECSLALDWGSDMDIVIKFPGKSDDVVQTSFTTKCHIRMLFWVALFGGVPFLISTAASIFFGCLFCRKRARNMKSAQREGRRKTKRRKQDKDELVGNEVVAEAGGVMAIQDG